MKAAVIAAAGKTPVYGDFNEPVARAGEELITVSASALSQFSRSRSSGSHYSSDGDFQRSPEQTVLDVRLMAGAFTLLCRKLRLEL